MHHKWQNASPPVGKVVKFGELSPFRSFWPYYERSFSILHNFEPIV